jgi:hypothetical protein
LRVKEEIRRNAPCGRGVNAAHPVFDQKRRHGGLPVFIKNAKHYLGGGQAIE